MLRSLLLSVGLLAIGAPAMATEAANLLFEESFSSPQLDGWTKTLSSGGTIDVKGGWATFEAPLHGRAHIARATAQDNIMVSAAVARWAAVYVVWDSHNWCGVGKVSPTPFGRFYSVAVASGKPDEVDHRGIDFNGAHRVRIQLGEDYVRFQYGDGTRYIDLRTIERPQTFAGAPKLIVTGRSYIADDDPFGANDIVSKPGEGRASGAVHELRIRPTPPAALKLTPGEIQTVREPPPEAVNAVLQKGNDDPTFEQIARYYPPMKAPREVVGVPAHPVDIGIDRLGRLDVSPWTPPLAWFEIGQPPAPFGRDDVPFTRRLQNGYLPILTLNTVRDGIEYALTVFGWSAEFKPENQLIAFVRFSARSSGAGRPPRQVAFVWGDGDKRHICRAAGTPGNRVEWLLRFKYPEPASVAEIPPAEFEARLQETTAFWTKRLAPAERFDLPDVRVMEAYRAWLVYSMLNSDTIDGYVEPHDGAGFYEEMFGNSVSLHTMAMDMYGLHDWATGVLDTQIHFQQPDGLYAQACGLVDPGGFLAGLAQHYRMTADRAWLQRVSPSIIRQCEWIVRQRQAAPKEGMLRGLIKFRPYNDYPDPVYNYLGNAWCAEGMRLAAAALKDLGTPESQTYATEAARYRQDILDSMAAAAITDKSQTILPMEPDTHRLLRLSKYRGGDYYGLVASPLLGTGLLAPDDKRATWIVDTLEKRGGLIAGVCEFECGIDHAYTYGYLMNALQRDEVRKTLLGFWSFFAFGMTRDTYSPVEVTMIATGENHYTLPHLYSCTEQLRLLRNLLIREEGDVLWLGQGIPRAWLEAGKHVAAKSAPTEFGEVSYRIDAVADGAMRVHIDPPTRRSPAMVKLRLRDPAHRSIGRVKATPETTTERSGETLLIRGLKAPVDLQIRLRAE